MTFKVVKEPISGKQARAAEEEASQKLMSGIERFVGDAPTTVADGNGGDDAAKPAQGWLSALYDKAARAAVLTSAVGATATTVGATTAEDRKHKFTALGDQAASFLGTLSNDHSSSPLGAEPKKRLDELTAAVQDVKHAARAAADAKLFESEMPAMDTAVGRLEARAADYQALLQGEPAARIALNNFLVSFKKAYQALKDNLR